MTTIFDDRPSDSPYVERVWRSYSEASSPFTSIATNNWFMVIEKLQGQVKMYVHGPERSPTEAICPPDGEWLGIVFKFGTFMPHLPTVKLINNAVNLPETGRSFWLQGAAWEFPTYENADTFANRLVRENIVTHEPIVDHVIRAEPNSLSLRTAQRHFRYATGLTHTDAFQIERARHATILLQRGLSILDTVHEAGYFDQSHLIRSLKRFIGKTPTQLIERSPANELSFLYNTAIFC